MLICDRWFHALLLRQSSLGHPHVSIREIHWCNGYRPRKWTRRHEFKSWTRLIAFHIALIPLGKVWIQLWVNSRADWFFSLGEATSLGEGKLWIQTCSTPLKNRPCVISCPSGGVGKYDMIKEIHWWVRPYFSSSAYIYIYIYIYIYVCVCVCVCVWVYVCD